MNDLKTDDFKPGAPGTTRRVRKPKDSDRPLYGEAPKGPGSRVWFFLAVFVLFAGGYSGIWYFAATTLQSETLKWLTNPPLEETAVIPKGSLDFTGFPFRAGVKVPVVTFKDRFWSWEITEAEVSVVPLPFLFDKLRIRVSGQQTLKLTTTGGDIRYRGVAETFDLRLEGGQGIPDKIALHVEKMFLKQLGEDAGIGVDLADIAFQRLYPAEADHTTPTARLDVSLRQVVTPPLVQMVLGNRIQSATVQAEFLGYLPLEPIGPAISAPGLADWRDSGGTVNVSRLELVYPPLVARGDGTLALDGNLQPAGAFSANIQGFFRTVDALQQRKFIRSSDASLAKIVLGALARTPANGGPASISLPLSLQQSALYAGPVKIASFPPVTWPGMSRLQGIQPRQRVQLDLPENSR